MSDSKRQAVKMAQAIISQSNPGVKVDGAWGPRSQKAFSLLAPELQNLVSFGVDVVAPGTKIEDLAQKDNTRMGMPSPELKKIIEDAATEFGLVPDELLAFVSIESSFNPNAVSASGTYKGLAQMGQPAWDVASLEVRDMGLPTIGRFSENWSDPRQNVRAAAAYARSNERVVRKEGYTGPWTAWAMYLAHQQGPAGFADVYQAAASGAKLSGTRLRAILNNPPQDGLGATADPSKFISRWSAVTNDRIAAVGSVA